MLQPVNVWPLLELTEEEREYVGHYASPAKPGVLRRVYTARLIQSTIAATQSQPTQSVNFSGRRVRVFGMTFSGDLAAWRLTITNPAGTLFTTANASVPALLGYQEDLTTNNMLTSWTFTGAAPVDYLSTSGPPPMLFDPNIIIEGTDSLIFQGSVGQPWIDRAQGQPYRAILNVAVHVWEFPDFPRERPFVEEDKGEPKPKPKPKVRSRRVAGVR